MNSESGCLCEHDFPIFYRIAEWSLFISQFHSILNLCKYNNEEKKIILHEVLLSLQIFK